MKSGAPDDARLLAWGMTRYQWLVLLLARRRAGNAAGQRFNAGEPSTA